MIFDWDDGNRRHIARHKISPNEAEEVLLNNPVDLLVQFDEIDGEKLQQVRGNERRTYSGGGFSPAWNKNARGDSLGPFKIR